MLEFEPRDDYPEVFHGYSKANFKIPTGAKHGPHCSLSIRGERISRFGVARLWKMYRHASCYVIVYSRDKYADAFHQFLRVLRRVAPFLLEPSEKPTTARIPAQIPRKGRYFVRTRYSIRAAENVYKSASAS